MGMIIQNGKLFSGEPKTTYTERVLWSGNQTVTTSGVDITLSDNLSEYDEVIFEYHDSSFNAISNFLVSGLTIGDSYIQEAYRPNNLGIWFTYTNDISLNVKAISTDITHTKITGIKYGDTVKRKDYHVYSTDEKIVGEWIDGSTLYERTYNVSSLSSSSILIDSNITSETAKIRNTSYGSYRLSGGGFNAQYVSHTSSSLFARIVFNPNGLYANIEGISSGVTASDFDITIRYTKSS